MQLDSDDLLYLKDCAITAARQAGQMIATYANKNVAVQHKKGGNNIASQVVTEVDLRSESIIVDVLQPTCKKYDLALLTEESTDDRTRLKKDYFWCIDPMDGTLSFIESKPGYSVSIALVSQAGIPVIGVVYDPVSQTLYSAVKGQGAMRNGENWSVNDTSSLASESSKHLTIVFDTAFREKEYYTRVYQALQSVANCRGLSGLKILDNYGAVLNACWVLENAPGCYFKCPKPEEGGGSLWDFSATAAIFHELGATASDVYGKPLDLNRADSTFMNHRGVIFSSDLSLSIEIQELLELCVNK